MKKEYRLERSELGKDSFYTLKETWIEGKEIVYALDLRNLTNFTMVPFEHMSQEVSSIIEAFNRPLIKLNKSGVWKEVKMPCSRKCTVSQKVKRGKK